MFNFDLKTKCAAALASFIALSKFANSKISAKIKVHGYANQ